MKTIFLAIVTFGLVGATGLAQAQIPAAAQQPVQNVTTAAQQNQYQFQVAPPVQYQVQSAAARRVTSTAPTQVPQVPTQIQQRVPTQIQQQVPIQNQVQIPIPTRVPNQTQIPGTTTIPVQVQVQNTVVLSKAHLRDLDRLMSQLSAATQVLHDQFHGHLEGVRHAAKLDQEVLALERQAESLQRFAATADGSAQSIGTLRQGTNELIQLAVRISRTIDLTEPWLPGNNSRVGIRRMRNAAKTVTGLALHIDAYLPVDTQVIDSQTERLEAAVKELHDEYHEHLEGYEVSRNLDADLEGLETLVEHMHGLAHNKSWAQINLSHLAGDVSSVRQKTAHIESLFVRQSEIGVRTRDWIGIEHSRDAITDVLSSAFLLDHMIRKTRPAAPVIQHPVRQVPLRDRHGHPIRPQGGVQPLHQQPLQQQFQQPLRQQPLQGQPQPVGPGIGVL